MAQWGAIHTAVTFFKVVHTSLVIQGVFVYKRVLATKIQTKQIKLSSILQPEHFELLYITMQPTMEHTNISGSIKSI